MPTAATLQSANRHYVESLTLAREAASRAKVASNPAATVAAYQATQALLSEQATAEMLAEQAIDAAADGILNSLAFTTEVAQIEAMIQVTVDAEFDRLVESLVQDAGRAAESVATAVRPNIGYVRLLTPPSCSRCTILAGRVYRYSTGFLRHPNCDCVMVPTTLAAPLDPIDPLELFEQGQVTGLSKADVQALRDGADFGRVVNVRLKKAGLRQAGRVLARGGRPTPEGIYKAADGDRAKAVALLKQYGYVL